MKKKNQTRILYVVFIISIILSIWVHIELLREIFIRVIIYCLMIIFLRFLATRENSDILKFDRESFSNLYEWTNSLDGGHYFVNKLIGKRSVDEDILVNLQIIKSEILISCNHDLKKLRLLEAYFKVIKQDKERDYYYTSIFGIMVSVGLLIGREILLSNHIPNSLNVLVSRFGFYDFLFLTTMFIAYLTYVKYLGNKRIELFQQITSQCIEERK
ncbi:hypothetical protein ABES03_10235 [Neobacillus rhizosphaerae]|uniref:hypothetical protein n=1 Tax=Neobacillus rhizosphaerae TaxID=2880965 RepID=UPI003D2901B8